MEYVKRKDALKVLGVTYQTLYAIAERKEIDTVMVGKNRLYNVNKYLREKEVVKNKRLKICYCRVSSKKEKEELEKQEERMRDRYPDHTIIKDIGSGIDYEREGIREIIEKAINGEIEELVIAYKDRLTRFGYEMIEWIIEKYSKGKIIVINKEEEETPKEEMKKDMAKIMNMYAMKVKGIEKYKKEIRGEIEKTEKTGKKRIKVVKKTSK